MDIQALVDAMGRAAKDERARYGLTLGGLIAALRGTLPDAVVVLSDTGNSPRDPHSYRGYYSDLAFEEQEQPRTVDEVLKDADAALDTTFTGYKGGDFVMGEDTPLWASGYGLCSGRAMMSCALDGDRFVITIKQVD